MRGSCKSTKRYKMLKNAEKCVCGCYTFAFFAFFGHFRESLLIPLEILNQKNVKVFSHEIIDIFQNAKVSFPIK